MVDGILFRILLMFIFGIAGWIGTAVSDISGWLWQLIAGLGGGLFGLLILPYLAARPAQWFRTRIERQSPNEIIGLIVGLFIGLIFSALLYLPLSRLPGRYGAYSPVIAAILLSLFFVWIISIKSKEILLILGFKITEAGYYKPSLLGGERFLVDTSAIIDGRIADISATGFLYGTLVIPQFVLLELQHIADSNDGLKRNRGRRGLEMLNRLQKGPDIPLQILDIDFPEVADVDNKLLMLAKKLSAPVITNDYNLNRVAELQGIRVLNVNELTNAVKPVFLPGEEIEVKIIQEGKESGQGVAFLDDGTMVVVEGAKRHMNNKVEITVTRVLQTPAGKMIFAQLKNGVNRER